MVFNSSRTLSSLGFISTGWWSCVSIRCYGDAAGVPDDDDDDDGGGGGGGADDDDNGNGCRQYLIITFL